MSATYSMDWNSRVFTGRKWESPERLLTYVAECLSSIYRFTGKSSVSVAEHSIYVALRSAASTVEAVRYALLHDATEAFMSDVPRPMKELLPEFSALEDIVLDEIYAALGHPLPSHVVKSVVKIADDSACLRELAELRGGYQPMSKGSTLAAEEWVGAYYDNEHRTEEA